jgi:hypothetical protein
VHEAAQVERFAPSSRDGDAIQPGRAVAAALQIPLPVPKFTRDSAEFIQSRVFPRESLLRIGTAPDKELT